MHCHYKRTFIFDCVNIYIHTHSFVHSFVHSFIHLIALSTYTFLSVIIEFAIVLASFIASVNLLYSSKYCLVLSFLYHFVLFVCKCNALCFIFLLAWLSFLIAQIESILVACCRYSLMLLLLIQLLPPMPMTTMVLASLNSYKQTKTLIYMK